MTPAARTQAAIEVLDAVIAAANEGGAAADTIVSRYFATRRYAGSKDRRAVREFVYRAIRTAGPIPVTGRAAMLLIADEEAELAGTFDGSRYGPLPIGPDEPKAEAGIASGWLLRQMISSGVAVDQLPALTTRAPLNVRVNSHRIDRVAVIAELPGAQAADHAPDAVRLPAGTHVEALPLWQHGLIEIQDEGSQIAGSALEAKPDELIVDLCAGAGGKSLALASAMHDSGRIVACDTDRTRLRQLLPRARRAEVSIIETRLIDPGREEIALADLKRAADGVLVDAPCSGTGTWRRNPEARWRLTPSRLAQLSAIQSRLLVIGADLVRPNGTLVYIVCSLLDREGADQIDTFLADNPNWTLDSLQLPAGRQHRSGVRLQPAEDGTDGFFVARLRAPC